MKWEWDFFFNDGIWFVRFRMIQTCYQTSRRSIVMSIGWMRVLFLIIQVIIVFVQTLIQKIRNKTNPHHILKMKRMWRCHPLNIDIEELCPIGYFLLLEWFLWWYSTSNLWNFRSNKYHSIKKSEWEREENRNFIMSFVFVS